MLPEVTLLFCTVPQASPEGQVCFEALLPVCAAADSNGSLPHVTAR